MKFIIVKEICVTNFDNNTHTYHRHERDTYINIDKIQQISDYEIIIQDRCVNTKETATEIMEKIQKQIEILIKEKLEKEIK